MGARSWNKNGIRCVPMTVHSGLHRYRNSDSPPWQDTGRALVASPSSVPLSEFPWLYPASTWKLDSQEPHYWSHPLHWKGTVHWFCQPSVYTVSLSTGFSRCTSPRDQLNYDTFQQWRMWQPGTSDIMGEMFKTWRNVSKAVYKTILPVKVSTLLNMIYTYKYTSTPITMKWHTNKLILTSR